MQKQEIQTAEKDQVLNFTPGQRVLLKPAGQEKIFSTELVGHIAGEYIIMRIPRIVEFFDHLHKDKKMAVQYVHEANRYAFLSHVATILRSPDQLLFLRHPASFRQVPLRKSRRVECHLPVEFEATINKVPVQCEAMLLDISPGGCKIVLDSAEHGVLRTFAAGNEITIKSHIIGAESLLLVEGTARKVTHSDSLVTVGVQFGDLSEQVYADLEEYFQSVQAFLE